MTTTTEQLIFHNLIHNEVYTRKVIPFIRPDYFVNNNEKIVFGIIDHFIDKYNKIPNGECLTIELDKLEGISEHDYKLSAGLIESITPLPSSMDKLEWLLDTTEKFCQDQAIYNALRASIGIIDGSSKLDKGAIPNILQEALAVTFDNHIGHDFIEDGEERFDFYHRKEERIPFDIHFLNLITKGGLPRKSLTCFMAPTGVGKSLIMCHMAASNLSLGKNVLYITMEMAEERIAERIDANLMGVSLDDLTTLTKEIYQKKLDRIKSKTTGRLIIKEYPAASATVNNFRHLLNELRIKKNFVPDIIYIDYLNICASARIKAGQASNTYVYIKSIAEEIRGLATEMSLAIVTATQTNRAGLTSTDMELDNTSESIGLPATLDLFIAVMQPEELVKLNQFLFKQLKNRYNDVNLYKRFVIGVDKPKMKLYDVEQSAQDDIMDDDVPLMDRTGFGERDADSKHSQQKVRFEDMF